MAGSADSNTNNCYDVFISHRGPDVKKTLASHLYRRLISSGLRVFLDYQELQEGEDLTSQIKGAIRNASAHVAILSPTYAESRWCLDELVLMLETEAPIIPVFHHVKPADLRHTQGDGLYARSLHNLENKMSHDSQPRYSSIDIENWRNALSRVADISGLDLEAFNGDEGELLDNVVKVVFKKGVKTKLNVARHPTGLNEKVEDFERKILLQQHNGRVQIVGITGLGGVGKTTLAKELFNRKSSNYSKSYFLFDIRENAKSSLHFLQSKILRGLLQLDVCIDNKDQGIEILRKQLSDSRVLLVLDDVDDVDQVDALLPVDVFSHDSLILITSRDKEILRRSGIHESLIYKLTGLNTEHSTQLFCSHAFCQPFPQPGFDIMVDKFVRDCGGLPLSLIVIGSRLYGNSDISDWEDVLNSLQKALPNEIQKKLQISYNALGTDEQHIFLDIACFLIGEYKDTAIRIWDGSGWNGRQGLQSLQNKCLVEVEVDNEYSVRRHGLRFKITMHDHLRDLGRDLAKDSNLPHRIWRGREDIDNLLQQPIGVTHVQGIRMLRRELFWMLHGDYRQEDHDELHQLFSSWDKRKLQLLYIDIESDLSDLHSPNLIWLSWHNCTCRSLPPWIPVKKLRVLQVTGRKLKTLWQDELQAPLHLRELQIYARLLTSIPKSIGLLKYLERLVVSNNYIEELPEEFCYLLSLKHLSFSSKCMRSLPDSFGKLTNLEHIDLSGCSELERLPGSFGNLIKLKYVNLSSCFKITLSSRSFGNITSLEYIYLQFCSKIKELPSQIAHQRSLKTLDLDLPNLKYWPPSATKETSGLEKLVLKTPLLKSLPSSLGHDLTNLKHLELQVCESLERMPELSGLAKLQILKISDCTELRELPSIETLVSLEVFVVCYCTRLKRIRGLAQLTKLREINVSQCYGLEETLEVENLKSLEKLRAAECVKLKNIRFSAQLPQLRKLDVSGCLELEELLGLEHLTSLMKLRAPACFELKSLQGLAQLTHLQDIEEELSNGHPRIFHPRVSDMLPFRGKICAIYKALRSNRSLDLKKLDSQRL